MLPSWHHQLKVFKNWVRRQWSTSLKSCVWISLNLIKPFWCRADTQRQEQSAPLPDILETFRAPVFLLGGPRRRPCSRSFARVTSLVLFVIHARHVPRAKFRENGRRRGSTKKKKNGSKSHYSKKVRPHRDLEPRLECESYIEETLWNAVVRYRDPFRKSWSIEKILPGTQSMSSSTAAKE